MSIRLAIKRAIDIALVSIVAIIASPLLIVTALAVRLTSRGPILLRQHRIGRGKLVFGMYKFRTMRADHEASDTWTASDVSAITPIGGFLRDYGLDELPQLLNIFKGDMSIIGPRPPLATQIGRYEGRLEETFAMRPGVLSLAAAEGRRGISPEERMELHLRYVQQWSLRLDLQILWKCLFVVLRKQNADEVAANS